MQRTVSQIIADLPGIVWLRRLRYIQMLRRGEGRGLFWGSFATHAEALKAARSHPSGLATGYDTPAVAEAGRTDYDGMHLRDYPALFWILRFLEHESVAPSGSTTVVDLGGHLGGKFRAFRRRWPPRASPSWIVVETAAVVELARGLSPGDSPPALTFTTRHDALEGASILLASGSLQYLERDLWDLLDDRAEPPRHLVLNKVPLSDGDGLWTTQDADGRAIVPYHVWNRARFIGELTGRGYRVLDEWSVGDRSVAIPFHRGLGTRANSGLSLTRDPRFE